MDGLRRRGRPIFEGFLTGHGSSTSSSSHLVRVEGGKAKEHRAVIDQLGMLQQLGLVPMPQQAERAA